MALNFNKQDVSNKGSIEFDAIPDKLFIPAVMVRDIVKARPLNRIEKSNMKRGGPDILVLKVSGGKDIKSREEISQYYRYLNNKPIKVMGWQSSKLYILYRVVNENVAVLQVPVNNTVIVNGKVANAGNKHSGDYIVCRLNEDGTLDRKSAVVISAYLFHKICYIPNHPAIQKSKTRANKSKYFSLSGDHNKIHASNRVRQIKSIPNTNIKLDKVPVQSREETGNKYNERTNTNTESGNKYVIVSILMNGMGQRVGFCLRDQFGSMHKVNQQYAARLCKAKKVSNMTVVDNGVGGYFFRGIGMSIDNLPIIYV